MNKEELITLIDSLNMPKNMYRVNSGGALLMMGIREKTADLDMCITNELFEIFKNKYDVRKKEGSIFNLFYISDLVEFFVEDDFEYTMIDNYPCETLESIIKFKEKHRRPKDLIDIENINKYLKRTI
jgi:hypothetical protein